MIRELYAPQWRPLLIKLCPPWCQCATPGKSPHPEGRAWQQRALARMSNSNDTDVAIWMQGIEKHLRAGGNVGLALPPHAVALDVDTDTTGGEDWSEGFAATAIDRICPDHPLQISGKRVMTPNSNSPVAPGVHVFGRTADRRPYGSHYGQVPVTIRGVGNMVVVAPSQHVSGELYEWQRELPDAPCDLPEFSVAQFWHLTEQRTDILGRSSVVPHATRGVLGRKHGETEAEWRARYSQRWFESLLDPTVVFRAGSRHEALLYLGWHLARLGAYPDEIERTLYDLAQHRCERSGRFDPGAQLNTKLSREVADIARTALRLYMERTQTNAPEPEGSRALAHQEKRSARQPA